MSLLLKDRVYTMQASTAKRGIYPMHGYKLGLYRMPIKLEDPAEIKSILEGMKKTPTGYMQHTIGLKKICRIQTLMDMNP